MHIHELKCTVCGGFATIKLSSKVWYNPQSWCTCDVPTLPIPEKTNAKTT